MATIATTREQSARLLQCGVSADTADMSWRTILCPSDNEPWSDPQLLVLPYSVAKDIYASDHVEPAWSLSALLSLIPPIIYAPDITDVPDNVSLEDVAAGNWVPPIRDYQWQMWCNPECSFEFEGEKTVMPSVYVMKYTSVRFLPPTHPIAPNSPLDLHLYDDDGNILAWADENPVEVCVRAIEGLTANNYKLNQL